MNKRQGLGSESGQGFVEYILLLVVVITLALLLTKLMEPYSKWAKFAIGDYVECLLDQGKLPALGGDGTLEDCEQTDEFRDLEKSLAQVSNPNGDGSAKSDPPTDEDSKKGNGNDKNKSGDSGGDKRAPGETEQSQDGGKSRRIRVSGSDGANGNNNNNGQIVAEAETKAAQSRENFRIRKINTGIRNDQGKGTQVFGLAGLLDSEKEKIKRREQKVQKGLTKAGEGTDESTKKKFEFKPSTRKSANVEIAEEEWSLGKLLRILLILVILIALVLFVSGQLVQISKGAEK